MTYAVLASGSGTNLAALIEAEVGELAVVITDVECGARERARAAGIPTELVPFRSNREEFTEEILNAAFAYGVDALVLAGFLRILGPAAPAKFEHRIVNIHPSLLPAFPGLDAVGQALSAGVKITGVTVHFVDDLVDHGPIIAQRPVPVLPDDDEATLHARIHGEEHDLYPRVVEALLQNRLQVEGRRVTWS